MTDAPRPPSISPAGSPAPAALAATLAAVHAVVDEEGCALHYGNPVAELTALRKAGTVALRNDLGILEIHGPEAGAFLQRLTANDVNRLTPNSGHANLFLNAKGRILAEFRLFNLSTPPDQPNPRGSYLALTPQACAKSLAGLLEKYHFSEKLTITDRRVASADKPGLCVVGVYGTQAIATLSAALAGGTLPTLPHQVAPYTGAASGGPGSALVQGWLIGVPASMLGAPGIEFVLPTDAAGALFSALRTTGLMPIGLAALGAASLEAACPRFGADFDDQVLPPEAGLTQAFSLTKGCYIGQEIMARMQTYGHHNKQITPLLIAGPGAVPSGATVFDGETKVGAVTSSIISPTLGRPIALAYVHVKHRTAGQALSVEVEPGQRIQAEVAAGPFVQV